MDYLYGYKFSAKIHNIKLIIIFICNTINVKNNQKWLDRYATFHIIDEYEYNNQKNKYKLHLF